MIEQQGIVRHIAHGKAHIEVLNTPAACSSCSGDGCGMSLFGRYFGNRRNLIELDDTIGVSSGDEVVIGIEENSLVVSAFRLYGAPLLGLIAGAVSAAALFDSPAGGQSDLVAIAGGITGFSLALVANYIHQTMFARQPAQLMRRIGSVDTIAGFPPIQVNR